VVGRQAPVRRDGHATPSLLEGPYWWSAASWAAAQLTTIPLEIWGAGRRASKGALAVIFWALSVAHR
jgi:hypothetical protein